VSHSEHFAACTYADELYVLCTDNNIQCSYIVCCTIEFAKTICILYGSIWVM